MVAPAYVIQVIEEVSGCPVAMFPPETKRLEPCSRGSDLSHEHFGAEIISFLKN